MLLGAQRGSSAPGAGTLFRFGGDLSLYRALKWYWKLDARAGGWSPEQKPLRQQEEWQSYLFRLFVFTVSVRHVSNMSGPGFGDLTLFFWNGGYDFGLVRWGSSRAAWQLTFACPQEVFVSVQLVFALLSMNTDCQTDGAQEWDQSQKQPFFWQIN